MKFIIWDPKDGEPPRASNDDATHKRGDFMTSGAVGRITCDNVYLTQYGIRPLDQPRYEDLEVGQRVRGVAFWLGSGTHRYDVYRVE